MFGAANEEMNKLFLLIIYSSRLLVGKRMPRTALLSAGLPSACVMGYIESFFLGENFFCMFKILLQVVIFFKSTYLIFLRIHASVYMCVYVSVGESMGNPLGFYFQSSSSPGSKELML